MQITKPFALRCTEPVRYRFIAFTDFFGTLTCRLPQFVSQDAHFRHVLPDPFRLRVGPGDPLPCRGVLDKPLTIPNQNANVEFVVKDAGLARSMTSYGRIGPLFAEWARDVVAIKVARDRSRTLPVGELSKYPLNDQSLRLIDRSLATNQFAARIDPLENIVSVAQAAARFALLDPPP